mgnify:CR=1 FL=1
MYNQNAKSRLLWFRISTQKASRTIRRPNHSETHFLSSQETYSAPNRKGARSILMYQSVTATGMTRKGNR